MSAVTAQFRSECLSCGYAIEIGDQIVRDEQLDGWSHAICPDDRDDSAGEAVCPKCNLLHAGECF